jgi:hypothetical protein
VPGSDVAREGIKLCSLLHHQRRLLLEDSRQAGREASSRDSICSSSRYAWRAGPPKTCSGFLGRCHSTSQPSPAVCAETWSQTTAACWPGCRCVGQDSGSAEPSQAIIRQAGSCVLGRPGSLGNWPDKSTHSGCSANITLSVLCCSCSRRRQEPCTWQGCAGEHTRRILASCPCACCGHCTCMPFCCPSFKVLSHCLSCTPFHVAGWSSRGSSRSRPPAGRPTQPSSSTPAAAAHAAAAAPEASAHQPSGACR